MQLKKFIEDAKKRISIDSLIIDEDILNNYSEDKSTVFNYKPSLVIRAKNKDEIREVVKLAKKYHLKIICWGSGSSVTGSCLAFDRDSLILSFERMNRIIEIDRDNLIAVVEPGVIVAELKKAAEKYNLFYPPDPASYESSTIGGNIATGAGGPSAVKYGVTKDYITGLEIILSTGEEIKLGGKIVKKSSGYNLIDIFISSEGTLGIITKIYLKLIPKPFQKLSFYVTFSDMFSLLKGVSNVLRNSILPVALEYIDDTALNFLYRKFNLPDKNNARASLLIEIDFDCDKQKEELTVKLYNIFSKVKGFINFYPLNNPAKEREIWEARRCIGEIFKENFKYIGKADIVVPRGSIFEVIKEIKKLGRKYGIEVSCFGHAGDGNIHVNYLINNGVFNKDVLKDTYKIVKKYGGLPSGEHGIGVLKKDILPFFIDNTQINLMKTIKKIFDPENILNSGKIFDINKN